MAEYTPSSAYRKAAIPRDLRWQVWERDNFTCRHCGTRKHLSVDHIVPEVRGGTTTLDNLQTLCCTCNSRKGTSGPGDMPRRDQPAVIRTIVATPLHTPPEELALCVMRANQELLRESVAIARTLGRTEAETAALRGQRDALIAQRPLQRVWWRFLRKGAKP